MVFSENIPPNIQRNITTTLGAQAYSNMEKCLGLPPVVGHSRRQTFSEIRTKVWHRLQGRKEKLLSLSWK